MLGILILRLELLHASGQVTRAVFLLVCINQVLLVLAYLLRMSLIHVSLRFKVSAGKSMLIEMLRSTTAVHMSAISSFELTVQLVHCSFHALFYFS